MTEHELFCRDLLRYGTLLQLTRVIGGSVCPCILGSGDYTPEWHRVHPGEPDCNGSGRIGTETVEIGIRAYVFNYAMLKTFVKFSPVGTICEKDIMLIGAVNNNDRSYLDLGELDKRNDTFEYQGERYRLRQSDLISTDERIARFAVLRRLEAGEVS